MDLRLLLTPEGAEFLRAYAEILPKVESNLKGNSEKLFNTYLSVFEDIGPHQEYFYQMLEYVKAYQDNFSETLSCLEKNLYATADKIDLFNYMTADDTDQSPPEKVLTLYK